MGVPLVSAEDEVPIADEGTVTVQADTAAPANTATENPLEGFAEAMVGWPSDPAPATSGEPEEAQAVEAAATAEAPKAPEAPAKEAPKVEDKPEPTQGVNFDGFSDQQKATWEKLLKAGHATKDEVEAARKDSLRQSDYSRKTDALKRDREAWEKEVEGWKEDKALLQRIRDDDRLHAAWLKMAKGEVPADETGGESLVDAKTAKDIARQEIDAANKQRAEATAKEQAAYDTRKGAVSQMLKDTIRLLGVSTETMDSYLTAEAEAFPDGADPIQHIIRNVDPAVLAGRLELRHKAALAEKRAADLEQQLTQRTSQAARTSKQSLPPARRVAEVVHTNPLKQTEADLGIAPDWSNVQGFGSREGPH